MLDRVDAEAVHVGQGDPELVRQAERVQGRGRLEFVDDTPAGVIQPVLTVADSTGALDSGVGINMRVRQSKIAFEVNLVATRRAQLNVSSKLLRLASEVRQ